MFRPYDNAKPPLILIRGGLIISKPMEKLSRFTRMGIYSILALSASTMSHAQDTAPIVLRGYMGIQGGESFQYKLELRDSVDNWLTGYAYTYLQENESVKTKVTGHLDRAQNQLHLRETEIVRNDNFKSKAIICLVDAILTYEKGQALSGPLKTHTMGNDAACSKGSISFSHSEEIKNLFSLTRATKEEPQGAKTPEVVVKETKAPKRIVYDTARATTPTKPAPVKAWTEITEGTDKTILWTSPQIIMEVWDGNEVDNDRISIYYNGEEVLSNYALAKEKKVLTLPVGGNELNILRIQANNEGNQPMNTATIRLQDGNTFHDIIANNKAGKSAIIKIKKQGPK